MFRKVSAIIAATAISLTVMACSPNSPSESNASTVLRSGPLNDDEGPALWETGDDDTTVYLFGTVHVLPPEFEWMTDLVREALLESDTVYLEADVSADKPDLMFAVTKLAFLPMGQDLFSMLNEEEQLVLNTAAEKLGLPTASLSKMKPWFAAMTIAMQSIIDLGQDPEAGVESILKPIAIENGKTFRYFETAEQQLSFLANLDDDTQISMLIESAKQIDDMGEMIIQMDNAWAIGDIETLHEVLMSDPSMASEVLHETMLIQRNKNWVVDLNALIEKEAGTFFVAVGAAHLIGEGSVVALLEDQGIAVQRIQ